MSIKKVIKMDLMIEMFANVNNKDNCELYKLNYNGNIRWI